MSLGVKDVFGVPEETRRVVRAAFRKGSGYMKFRDEPGPVYADSKYASLFAELGGPAGSPGRLALECVGETMRHALNILATVVPGWLRPRIKPEWADRYGKRLEEYR